MIEIVVMEHKMNVLLILIYPAVIIARTFTCTEKVRKVTSVDKYYATCLNIKDILRAELEACWFDSFPMTFFRYGVTYIV
jgi:hypothetical protein